MAIHWMLGAGWGVGPPRARVSEIWGFSLTLQGQVTSTGQPFVGSSAPGTDNVSQSGSKIRYSQSPPRPPLGFSQEPHPGTGRRRTGIQPG